MKRILSLLLLIFWVNSVSMHAQYEYDEDDFKTAEGYAKYKQYQEFFKERDNTYSKQLGFPHGEFPTGTFKADKFSQPFSAAFFNKNKTEYPSETELNIKWDKKKKRYDITYFMNFPDGRTVKGSYTGQIPESTF